MSNILLSAALIALVKKNPVIWDDNNVHYNDNEQRQKVWLKIFDVLSKREDCSFNNGKITWKLFKIIFNI